MKTTLKISIKLISISILTSCFTLAVYASTSYQNTKTAKTITKQKTITSQVKLANLDPTYYEETEKQIEDWMLDDKFWKIKTQFEWEEEPIEKERDIENWMNNISIKKNYSKINFNDKEWMEKQSFYIL